MWLGDGSGFLWFTERNGGPEVELRAKNGAVQRTLVPKEFGYEDFVGWDDQTKTLYFLGSPNPTESVLYRVMDGGAPERVKTDESGPAMQAAVLSKDGQHLAVITTTLKYMSRAAVWRIDGARVATCPRWRKSPS